MKNTCIIALLLLTTGCKNNYIEIVKDFGLHSYYIALEIKWQNQKMIIALENAMLYSFLNNDTFKEKEYINLMHKLLDKKDYLKLNEQSIYNKLIPFQVDTTLVRIKKLTHLSSEVLINNFFDKNEVLKVDLSSEEKRFLIYILFQRNIFVKDDDETGYLYIP
jgi:hypothetical protein